MDKIILLYLIFLNHYLNLDKEISLCWPGVRVGPPGAGLPSGIGIASGFVLGSGFGTASGEPVTKIHCEHAANSTRIA